MTTSARQRWSFVSSMAFIILLHIRNEDYKHTYTFSVQKCKFPYKKDEKTYKNRDFNDKNHEK